MPEPKTYTEEEVTRIVNFASAVERLRERAISGMNLAIQRARAAGDTKESVASLEWIAGGIELLIARFVQESQQEPKKPEPKPDEADAEQDDAS